MRALLVLVAACHDPAPPNYARFIETTDHPNEVRKLIAARAEAAGLQREVTLDVDRYTVNPVEQPVEVSATPEGDHTLIELRGAWTQSLDLLARGGETYDRFVVNEERDRLDPYQLDVVVEGGFAHAPHTDAMWRIDPMVHVGRRVWTRGGETHRFTTRARLTVFGGLGLAIDNTPAIRPEVGVTFDLHDAATRLRPWVSTRGTGKAISLAFSTPLGKDHVAYEASLALHAPPYGGLFVRAGYERGDLGDGMTWMAGARLDTKFITSSLSSVARLAAGVLVLGGGIYLYMRYLEGRCSPDPC